MLLLGGCTGVAAVSLVLFPTLPFNDPTTWLIWAWEIGHGGITIFPTSPSWKPLPVFVALPWTVFSPDATTFAWLTFARAGAFAASVLLFRIAARSGGWVGGGAAAAVPWLLPPWDRAFVAGACEPVTAAMLLGAIEAHLSRKPKLALVLLSLAALMRPEAAALVAAYGVWCLRRRVPSALPVLCALALVGAALWVIPMAVWFDDPMQAFSRAAEWPRTEGWLGNQLALNVESPLALAAAGALVLAGLVIGWQRRDRAVAAAIAAAGAWLATIALGQLAGSPSMSRYMLPGTIVLVAVLGAGVGGIVTEAGSSRRWLGAPAAVLSLALVALVLLPNATTAARIPDRAAQQLDSYRTAKVAIARAGGLDRLLACTPITGNRLVAWNLYHGNLIREFGLRSSTVRWKTPAPTVAIVTHDRLAWTKPEIKGETARRLLAEAGEWRVVYIAGAANCGGFSAPRR